MAINVETYKINYALKQWNNYILIIPFDITMQTSSLTIENYCKNKYPKFISYKQFNLEELYELQKMKSYVKSHITESDIKDIINFLVQKGWLTNIPIDNKIFTIKVNDASATTWTSQTPYLQLNCSISINVKNYIDWFVSNKYLQVINKEKRFIKEIIELAFMKPLSFILMGDGGVSVQQITLQLITNMCNTKSVLSDMLDRAFNIDGIYTFKKEVKWINDNRIRIVIDDFAKLLKIKINKNIVPLSLAGIYMYKKDQEKKRKEIALQQLNIYNKYMTDLIKDTSLKERGLK